jgi:DNA-binding transcriptional LysR family regulator
MIRPDLDITLLRCFLTVLDAGGFARAASLLGRTQPAVSQQIRRLEDLLGHRLIQRASPGRSQPPQPTAAGERLAEQARRLIALHDGLVADMLGLEDLPATLRLGIHQHASDEILGRLVAEVARLRPGTGLDLRITHNAQLAAEIAAGELDLALPLAIVTEGRPEVVQEGALPIAIDWRGEGGNPAGGAALPLIAFRPPCIFRQAAIMALGRAGRRWRLVHEATDARSLAAALSAGLGIAAVPDIGRYDDIPRAPAGLGLPPLPGAMLRPLAVPGLGADLVAALAGLAAGR